MEQVLHQTASPQYQQGGPPLCQLCVLTAATIPHSQPMQLHYCQAVSSSMDNGSLSTSPNRDFSQQEDKHIET